MKQTLNLGLKISVHIKWGDFVLNIISCHSFNDLRKKIWKNSGCITFGGSKGSTSFLNFLLLNGSSEVIDDFVSLITREKEEKDNFNWPWVCWWCKYVTNIWCYELMTHPVEVDEM